MGAAPSASGRARLTSANHRRCKAVAFQQIKNPLQIGLLVHEIQVVGRDDYDGGEGVVLDPLFVQPAKSLQIAIVYVGLVAAAALGDVTL